MSLGLGILSQDSLQSNSRVQSLAMASRRDFSLGVQVGAPRSTSGRLGNVPGSQAALEMEGPEAARLVGSVAAPL